MELQAGTVAVVTGAASGIGRALAHRFAADGLAVVLADVDEAGLAETAEGIATDTLIVPTDVADAAAVEALATAATGLGTVSVVCNNAGVASTADPWFGPLASWDWTIGVNLMGVVHGVRAFLPHLSATGGHIVNTASLAGLLPGFSPPYDATKHAVVALTEGLYNTMKTAGLPVGVSCLCPGWVNTGIGDAERNWPAHLGEKPETTVVAEVMRGHLNRALSEGLTPAAVADLVATAVTDDRFWIFPHPDWMSMVVDRWDSIRASDDPTPPTAIPGMPDVEQVIAEVMAAMADEA